jgi:16S rRNA (cytidine1402-2'-O)-methyltransferase
VITALTLSGLPTDQFHFAGFLPNAASRRKSALAALGAVPGTLIFYESPKRLGAMLRDAAGILGEDRMAAVCRELTKKFEEVLRGPLGDLAAQIADAPPRGEIVVLVGQAPQRSVNPKEIKELLETALSSHSVRDATDIVAAELDVQRRMVYQMALEIEKEK